MATLLIPHGLETMQQDITLPKTHISTSAMISTVDDHIAYNTVHTCQCICVDINGIYLTTKKNIDSNNVDLNRIMDLPLRREVVELELDRFRHNQ